MELSIEQRITAVILSLILLIVTVQLIRKHRLREEYALGWLGASISILFLSLFGHLISDLFALFAVSLPSTFMLSLGLVFALIILLSQSVVLSTQANHIRDLVQNVAILEWRLRQCEQVIATTDDMDSSIQKKDGEQ